MNICFVTGYMYPDKTGGTEVFNYYLIDNLKQHHKITLLSHSKNIIDDVDVVQITKSKSFINTINIFRNIVKIRKKIDVLHLSFMYGPRWFHWYIFPIIKKVLNIPYIVSIHGGRIQRWKFKYPYFSFFLNADQIIGVSEQISREYEKRLNKPVLTIHSDIPLNKNNDYISQLEENIPDYSDCKVFSIIGSIKKIKNPFTIIKSIELLGEEYSEKNHLLFLFVGEGNLKKKCLEYLSNNKIKQFIRFIGNVDRDMIPTIYSVSYAYIIASEFESNSISAIEAVYNKVPVIASDVRVINSTFYNDEILFFPLNDAEILKEQVMKIVEDQDVYKKIVEKTYQRIKERFDFNVNVLNKYLEVYKNVTK